MGDSYEKNGYGGDFKRNAPGGGGVGGGGGGGGAGKRARGDDGEDGDLHMSEKAAEYLRELISEKIKVEQAELPIAARLVADEVNRVQSLGRIPQRDNRYVDIYREKPVKVTAKVLVPVNEHPKFNFVGKLLGPKGSSMKQLQEDTMCKMAVLGRGSMKDRQKEEELRSSLDPKYAHLSDDLHVEISALGPPAEAHARIAYALAEVRKYLIPDANDTIRQAQMRQMMERGPGMRPPPRSAPPSATRSVMPAKTKIMSILDRARAAMEDTYSYDDPYAHQEPPVRRSRPPPEADYYGYERAERHHYPAPQYDEEAAYYKDDSYKEYKSVARDVGSRRGPGASAGGGGGGGASRYPVRDSPYARPSK